MTHSVISVTNQNNNSFGPFQLRGPSYTASNLLQDNKNNESDTKNSRAKKLGYEIGGTAILAGFGVFALMKGLPKGARKSVDRFFRYVDEKISTITDRHEHLSMLQTLTLRVLKGARFAASRAKALFNLGPIKDTSAKHAVRWLDKKGYPNALRLFNWITKIFEKTSLRTVKRAYEKALTMFDNMSGKFAQVNSSILGKNPDEKVTIIIDRKPVTKTRREWVQEIEEKDKHIHARYRDSFGRGARDKRLIGVQQDLENIDQEIYAIIYGHMRHIADVRGMVKDQRTYKTFISEEVAAGRKISHTRKVHDLRREISNNVEDTYSELKDVIGDLEDFLDPSDREARKHIKELKRLTEEYRNLHGAKENEQREKLNETILQILENLDAHIKDSTKYDKETTEQARKYVDRFRHVVGKRTKGEVQEILTIYRALLRDDPQQYKAVKKVADKATGALKAAVEIETDKLFDKLRDLAIGCAPLDALGLVAGLGAVGVGLGKADNTDERISAGLKYGVPALGTIGTMLYLTAGLVSGGAAIALSLLMGVAINKICTYVDNERKKLKITPLNFKPQNLPNLILNEAQNTQSVQNESTLQPSN